MDKENIYIMKQPELGRKISELRKQQGLTQEELVEKCNINVRTIQRIEAGEVTPRSYTVKAILDALGVDLSVSALIDDKVFTSTQKRILQSSWIFGIIYLVIGFIETYADIYQFSDDTSTLNTFAYATIKIISLFSFIMFLHNW